MSAMIQFKSLKTKTILLPVLLVAIFSGLVAPIVQAQSSSVRLKAKDILFNAYSRLERQRDDSGGVSEISIKLAKIDIDRALAIDPEFAYANIVRAQVALMERDWEVARDYFLKGIKLTYQPDQIYSPDPSIAITAKEVRTDAQVFLAFSHFQLANEAIMKYDLVSAQLGIEKAKSILKTCLASKPSHQTKEMAEELLVIVEQFFGSN